MTREGWHYFATNLDGDGGEHLIAPDLPIAGPKITATLSGPDALTGTIPVEVARLRGTDFTLFEPWRTCVYAELGGVIRGGGIVTSVDVDDATVSLTCAGFTAFATGMPYSGEKNYIQADPFTIAREFWADLQARNHCNIGLKVVCSPSTTPVRLGRMAVAQWATIDVDALAKPGAKPAPLPTAGTPFLYTYTDTDSGGHSKKITRYGMASRAEHYTNDKFPEMWWDTSAFTTSRGKLLFWSNGEIQESDVYPKSQAPFPGGMTDGVIRENGKIVFAILGYITSTAPKADTDGEDLEPWKLNFFDTLDLGSRWNDLTKDGGFDYYETHAWVDGPPADPKIGDSVGITHTVHLGYPSVGRDLRTSDHHRFEVGVNILDVPSVSVDGDDYADYVIVIGAGEGRAAVRGEASVGNKGRLHRTRVVQDTTLKTKAQAQKRAAQWASSYAGDQNISSLKVANHPNAPLGSYGVGDTIQAIGSGRGWSGDLNLSLRITGIEISPDEGDMATLAVARPDKVSSNA